MQFVSQKYKSFIAAPLAPFALVLILGLFIFLLGLIGNIPYAGELLVAIGLIPGFVIAFLITLLVIGSVAGFMLMYPAIAFEASDSFDAISRSFSYIYSKPWRMGFYTLVAAIYGAICYLFAWLFAAILLNATYLFLRAGLWAGSSTVPSINKLSVFWPNMPQAFLLGTPENTIRNWSESAAAFIISIMIILVFCVLTAFVVSFFFSATSTIYALMRQKVDNVSLNEISIQKPPGSVDKSPLEELPRDEPA